MFRPNDNVTREQLAVFFKAFAAYRGMNVLSRKPLIAYADQSSISSYAKEAMSWAVAMGLISGKGEGKLAPKDTATRAELAQMLYRFMNIPNNPEPSETAIPNDSPKPTASAKPTESPKPTESAKPTESPKPTENTYSISFKEDVLDVDVGASVPFEIETVAPSGTAVTYTISDPAVAKCSGSKVTGISLGSCVLTAQIGDSTASCTVYVNDYVNVDEAYTLLNEFRTSSNVWYWNPDDETKTVLNIGSVDRLSPLARNEALENTAKIRAKELPQKFSHTRPDGTDCFTAYPSNLYAAGENIAAGYTSAEAVTVAWEETDEPYSGQGHRRNMLSKNFNSVGIAGYMYRGRKYWVQSFGYV